MLPLSSASSSARSTSGSASSSSSRMTVDAGQLRARRCASRSLRLGRARDLERLPRHSARTRRCRRRHQAIVARRSRARSKRPRRRPPEHLERAVDQLRARSIDVGLAEQRDLGERGQRPPSIRVSPGLARVGAHRLHLDETRRQVGEPPGGARGVVAALERRLELDRAQQQLARASGWPRARARACRPASSAAAASLASSAGGAPSSSASSGAAWSRW